MNQIYKFFMALPAYVAVIKSGLWLLGFSFAMFLAYKAYAWSPWGTRLLLRLPS